MTRSVTALLLIVLQGGAAVAGHAQRGARAVCFRAMPGDHCRGFLITEFATLVGPATGYRRPPANMIWDVGYAHHIQPRRAVGASLTVIADDDGRVLVGIRPRFRQWLDPHTSLDIAPAILIGHTDAGGQRMRYPGVSAYVGVGWRDLVALNAQVEVIRLAGLDHAQTAWLFGLRLASYAGLVAAPLGAAFVTYAKSFGDN